MKRVIMKLWTLIPFGYLCRFWYGSQRITLQKNGWIIVDSGKGTTTDALPITLVSQKLVDECIKQLNRRGYPQA